MTLELDTVRIEDLIPHKGGMCLWQNVEAFDDEHVMLSTNSHKDSDNPLRSEGELRAIHLCEYGAQAMAVHGGLLARAGGEARKGYLVALRGVDIRVPRLDTLHGALQCEARLLMNSASSQQYAFRLLHEAECIAEGRAAVMLAPIGESDESSS
ncbi:phosphotransferase [Lysobacter sp. HDW10]|uniref:phosphotransferase n=1 Tax=Lysobacter sp. HDW10 TaxID=2714936 RepID=UPI00140A1651|nr:phosphotransferase [Lysobacter sp. HDW10]QIK80941.1 phosphotransferase [Lysobacter sp. HDW10]